MKPDLLKRFIDIVGKANALTGKDDLRHYTHENRGIFIGRTPLVLKPASTDEVSKILKLAAVHRIIIVPQGGHTGHVGGAVPHESGDQIVLSLERMNKIRDVDLNGNVIVCEAGCILETIQKRAEQRDRLFPLALASQGSCQIGGNISTNAGGTGVLAYGNTRQLVLGLEVVLPSGEIWNGLRRLKKDNTGYDLKNLFIGAEGTLGIVTAAVLKLFPRPKGKAIAFCGMQNVNHALDLLTAAQSLAGSALTAFEFMARLPVDLTVQNIERVRNPLKQSHNWHVLIEISSSRSQDDATQILETVLSESLEAQIIEDAALATSIAQQNDFWHLREAMPLAQLQEGGSIKHDISVPVHRIPEFLPKADKAVSKILPNARLYTFGHMGDGNIHYNVSQPVGEDKNSFLSLYDDINKAVHGLEPILDL